MYPSNGICVKNVFIIQHFYLNCSTLFCSEFLSWRKEIQWWYCLSLEAYVTESSEFQSFIQAVDSTGHVCSSVSFSLWERRMMRTRLLVQGEIAFFPFSQLVSSVAQSCPTPWTAARQASLSITNSWSLLKIMSITLVMLIQWSYPLSSPSPPTFNLSQHQGLFQWVSFSHQVDKVLELQLQHQSFQWVSRTSFRIHWLDLLAVL